MIIDDKFNNKNNVRGKKHIPDLRKLPPCMGGIRDDKSISQDPIPGSARFREIKHQIALEQEKEEKEIIEKRIEKVEKKLEDFEKLEGNLEKFDKQIRNLKQQQMSRDDIKRLCFYEEIGEYSEGLAVVRDKYGKYGYIDKNNKEVIKCKYDEAHAFKNGIAIVKENGYYGCINKHEKKVISCVYDEIFDFRYGLAVIKKDGYYGYVNKNNEEVIECKYDEVSYFNKDGKACVKKDGKIYIINNNGKIIDLKLHENGDADKCLHNHEYWKHLKISDFFEGFAVVKKSNSYCYVDRYGYKVSENFDEAFPFSNGRAIAKKDGAYFYLSVNSYSGRVRVYDGKCRYEAVSDFVEDIACVKKSGKLFFINNNHEIIRWNFPEKNKNIENSTDEVMYNPVFVEADASKVKVASLQIALTFFRENGEITFMGEHCNYPHDVRNYGFKIVDNIDADALTHPWLFCNGIPFYKKDGYIFVIDIDFEHEDKKNEHDGLGSIRYIRRLFGYRYFQMVFENNELKKMAFENSKIESEEDLKEKISNFMDAVKEYLVKNGELGKFLETLNKNKHILDESNEWTDKTSVDNIQSENYGNSENDKEKTIKCDEIYNEIIRIAKEQKKLFEALNRLIEKTKLLSNNNPEFERIIKDIFQNDILNVESNSKEMVKKIKRK